MAIKQVVVQFRLWCLAEGLYGREVVAIDGSKFKALNNNERNFTRKKLAKVISREQVRVEEYLQAIEAADEEEIEEPQLSAEQLREKLKRIKEKLAGHEELLKEMKAKDVRQIIDR